MKLKMAIAALALSTNSIYAQNETIRLIYPQWQGGDIAKWITEVPNPDDASRGYYLGAQFPCARQWAKDIYRTHNNGYFGT